MATNVPGTTYRYKVAACNSTGAGPLSAAITVASAPHAPTGLSATAGNAMVTLSSTLAGFRT